MRVQLCGTELHFITLTHMLITLTHMLITLTHMLITLTHMLITIYSYDFSCLNCIRKKPAFLRPLCLIAYLPTLHISSPRTFCQLNFYRKTDLSDQLVPTDWPLVHPGFPLSSNFQMKSDGSYWLKMLNFVISNWSKVTILNALNPLVPIYVTLLPMSQPVWTPTRVILGCLNGQAWLIWNPSSKI